jgi:D-glycerate 3-kinase
MSVTQKDWIDRLVGEQRLPAIYASNITGLLQSLADRILERRHNLSRPVVIGINGGQGSGKSTLSFFLVEWLERECGLSAACLSLDDLYLSKAKRQELASSIHSLFATRGVPGTHDVALGLRVLDELVGTREVESLAMPRFDKAADDLLEKAGWPVVKVPVDVVVFEGWCVGAKPQPDAALEAPINALEAEEDPDGRWRIAVNAHLKTDYAELFGRLDMLVMLRVPSFEKAIEWRQLQESKLSHQQNEDQLLRFMLHFERLTRHMLESVPAYADSVIDIDDQHNFRRQNGLSV